MKRKTLVFGAGFSGKAYGCLLAEKGEAAFGTTRSWEKFSGLETAGLTPLVFDGKLTPELDATLADVTDIVISAAPGEDGDPVLNALEDRLAALPSLKWVGYLSTVGVYGNHDGDWVDEETPVKPVSLRSVQRVEAENRWMGFSHKTGVPVAILRLSGIYGPGRNALANLEDGTARRLVKPGQVFNRIHVGDIAGALDFLSSRRAGGVWNVTDDEPSPPQDVVEYAASVMKIDPPDEIDFETATLSPMARSFYGENKRVSNAKIKHAGFSFGWPDYRTALRRMWEDGSWRG